MLNEIITRYPFRDPDGLRACVLDQTKKLEEGNKLFDTNYALVREELATNCLNWLAEPFFKGEKYNLNNLLEEYDYYTRYPSYRLSKGAMSLFYIRSKRPMNGAPYNRYNMPQRNTDPDRGRDDRGRDVAHACDDGPYDSSNKETVSGEGGDEGSEE